MRQAAATILAVIAIGFALSCTKATQPKQVTPAPQPRVTPQESLRTLANVIERRDWNGFRKYVDVDSVAQGHVDAKIDKEIARRYPGGGGVLARAFARSMRPRFVAQAKGQMRQAIERPGNSRLERALRLFREDSVERVAERGDVATVTLSRKGAKGQALELEMKRAGDHWQVTKILNASDFV